MAAEYLKKRPSEAERRVAAHIQVEKELLIALQEAYFRELQGNGLVARLKERNDEFFDSDDEWVIKPSIRARRGNLEYGLVAEPGGGVYYQQDVPRFFCVGVLAGGNVVASEDFTQKDAETLEEVIDHLQHVSREGGLILLNESCDGILNLPDAIEHFDELGRESSYEKGKLGGKKIIL